MRFAFTDEQLQFRAALRQALSQECPPAAVREGAPGAWALLVELGILGVGLPEALGGSGLDARDWILLAEEAGRAALPVPLSEALGLLPALARGGMGELAADVAAGRQRIAVGEGIYVDADLADVVFHLEGGRISRFSHPHLTRLRGVSEARRIFKVEGVRMPLDGDGAAAFDAIALATSAELLGLAARQLELAVAYARERHQFGKAIGSFQAVQHRLADALLALSFARPVVYRAAHSIAALDPDARVHVSMAKAKASDAAYTVRRAALQVHGAIGYTLECDLQLWMKRSMALEAAWGGAAFHRSRVGDALLKEDHA